MVSIFTKEELKLASSLFTKVLLASDGCEIEIIQETCLENIQLKRSNPDL